MAFPFKTGGDFYNCEALNMRLHNHSADLNEYGTGTIYFNTGSNTNHSKHAVVHDGTNFKALAFVDEIATNTAFTELTKRVLTIEKALGEDTAGVIDTWEEIQNFLKDIDANDANLMTMLDDKLSKSQGGTITGALTLSKEGSDIFVINRLNSSSPTTITYRKDGSVLGRMGFDASTKEPVAQVAGTYQTLLHSGNIGDYALKTDGSNKMKGGISWGRSTSPTWNVFSPDAGNGIQILNTVGNSSEGAVSDYAVGLAVSGYYGFCLGYNALNKRAVFKSSHSEFGEDWKTIAFTDSDITGNAGSATKLSDDTAFTAWGQTFFENGKPKSLAGTMYFNHTHAALAVPLASGESAKIFLQVNPEGNLLMGQQTAQSGKNTRFYGNNIYFCYGTAGSSSATAMTINSSGNVLIGTTTDSGYKLDVYGGDIRSHISEALPRNIIVSNSKGAFGIRVAAAGNRGLYDATAGNWMFYTNGEENIIAYKPLRIDVPTTIYGDLYVDGNIIATKEVAAGGAGQEGESGDGGAEVIDKELAKGQSSYTIPNTIGRSAVAVSLYEWNANNGSWDMCLADISVKDATITVTFGSATSVNHKLVAVG